MPNTQYDTSSNKGKKYDVTKQAHYTITQ